MQKISIILFFTLIGLYSCETREAKKLEEQYISTIGTKVVIPFSNLIPFPYKENMDNHKAKKKTFKYVSYIDSTECTNCHLSQIHKWNKLQDSLLRKGFPCEIVIIYAPKRTLLRELEKSYHCNGFTRTIFFDLDNAFTSANPHLPKDYRLHTFLLDRDGKVALIGNPIANKSVSDILFKYIATSAQ